MTREKAAAPFRSSRLVQSPLSSLSKTCEQRLADNEKHHVCVTLSFYSRRLIGIFLRAVDRFRRSHRGILSRLPRHGKGYRGRLVTTPLSLAPTMDVAHTVYACCTRKLVVALDIGTTFSGAAYAFLDPGEIPRIRSVTK